MKNKIWFLLLFLLLPLISANGLYTPNETISINKTYGINQNFIVTIRNADTIPFYNITIDTAGFSMQKINILQPNQSANITVTISTNENFVGKLRIKGYYQSGLGASNETHQINVNYGDGAIPCVFSIVKGDTLVWINTDTKIIEMYNTNTHNKITTIQAGGTYSQKFDTPLIFNYHLTWLGFDFSYCSVNVLDDTGYITNADYDALIDLNLKIQYTPTTIEPTFLVTDYSMGVLDTQEGLIMVKNVGSYTAKNISLSGEWFSFTPNTFDLEPNVTRIVTYKIKPSLSTTNQTNKTYTKEVKIEGNFPTSYQNFTIFVKYADFSSPSYGYSSLEDYLKRFCDENPEFCYGGGKVIYVDNGTGQNLTQDQFRKIIEFWAGKFDLVQEEITFLKEQGFITANQSVTQTQIIETLSQDVEELKKQKSDNFSFVQILIIGVALFVVIVGGALLIRHYKNKKLEDRMRRWN